MENIFVRIYRYFESRHLLLYTVFGLCFAIAVFFAAQVTFEEDISKVLPKDKKIEKLNDVFQNSKFLDKLVVMVALKDTATTDPDALVLFADTLAAHLQENLNPYISKVDAKVDDGLMMDLFNVISNRLPIYLSEKDYQQIDTLIAPEQVKRSLEQNFRTLTSPAGIALKGIISKDPVGISFIALKKLQQLQYDESFELYDSYVFTKDHKHLLVFITPAYPPSNTGKNEILLQGLDNAIKALASGEFKTISATYFGATAVAVGNALQLRRDTLLTQGITVLFLIVFLGLYFRKKSAPLIILIPVIFGALFALAAIFFIKGSISVIALGTGSVILGIAVNYSLHVFNHYRHVDSITTVIKDLTLPLTIGSFTTIGGFVCLEFVASDMLKDLGLFAAFSLIGASLCSLIFLPHLVVSKKGAVKDERNRFAWIDRVAAYRPEYNKFIVLGILVLTISFAYTAKNVSFETDMMRMNFMSDKLKQAEADLNKLNQYSLSSIYLVAEGKTLDEALVNNERVVDKIENFKSQSVVKKYSGVSSLVISDSLQRIRIKYWQQYWTSEKKQQLFAVLEKEGTQLGFKPSAFDAFQKMINADFSLVDQEEMAAVRKSFLGDYITENAEKSTVITLVKLNSENKQTIYNAFENDPNVTVVDKQYLTSKFVAIINADFNKIALMSSILVFVVLLLTYGRIELTLISFIPMFITWVWILGIMGLLDIHFNIVNIIISALIFGLGDDYSLFIMDGLLQEYKTGKKNLSSYKSSIFLSAITTIAGLGVLIFAAHPALKSIALIAIIGILCVVVMSQILIPFFFNLFIKDRKEKKFWPWTLASLAKSIFAFSYFIFGCLLLTIIGLFLVKLNPFNKEKGKHIYHSILSSFSWSMIFIMSNVKKVIINKQKEDFVKPAVIICNHQSFLDILVTIMLYPKLILFTNNWVWNSPVFGAVARMADFYPVDQGAENSIELLADRVKNGYSVVIFPEGTRSIDGTMKRFHKGAFYLAQELNMDILPILLHGTGYTSTKGDFMIKDGHVTLKFLPRITPEDTAFGIGYAERTKLIGRYFRGAYQDLITETEKVQYFKKQLIANYIYKGPVLEWYMRIKIGLEKNYQLFDELVPKQGKILDMGCGYGFMSYMLHFTGPERIITGVDYDDEKIATANQCTHKNEQVNFISADVLKFDFEKYDTVILADMLHYLQPNEQRTTIIKCIKNLNPGGVIIIRDGNKDLEEKHKGTRLTEFFSTKFVGFNKTSGEGLSFMSGSLIREIAASNGMSCEEIDQTKYTSNIIFILKEKGLD